MPYKPKKPCAYPNCPELTHERFCEKHRPQAAREYNRYGRDEDSNLCREQERINATLTEHFERIIRNEESIKSAHKRLDEITKNS